MTPTLAAPLAPFADALPVPRRLVAARQNGRLSVPIRAGAHRFHRDLPESAVWGYDGMVPGPTIEAEAGEPVTVQWRNELGGALPVVVTTAPEAADASGVPVQCVPGLSGGTPDQNAAALAGHAVVHLHGGLTPHRMTAGPRTCPRPARMPSSTTRWASGRRCCGTTTT
jgi:o-aminophenol oxidase